MSQWEGCSYKSCLVITNDMGTRKFVISHTPFVKLFALPSLRATSLCESIKCKENNILRKIISTF